MPKIKIKRAAVAMVVGTVAAILPLGAIQQAQAAVDLFDFTCASGGTVTGNFNNDDYPDLAIGAVGDNLEQVEIDGSITEGFNDTGSINVVYSSDDATAGGVGSGPNPAFTPGGTARKFFSQNTPGVVDNAEVNDSFGFALAAGNFDGVKGDDLAIGVPGENGTAGGVHMLYADDVGLAVGNAGTEAFNQLITQDSAGVDGISETGDLFGYALASGDINGDNFDDLVIGTPREDIGSIKDAGFVQVLYGSASGISPFGAGNGGAQNDEGFDQGSLTAKTPEVARREAGDFFGASLAVGQFNGGGNQDVAVGAPGEDIGKAADAGSVKIFYSNGGGMDNTGSDFFHQDTKNFDGLAEPGDRFACTLAAGDYDGDGGGVAADDDLAVGAPGESVSTDDNAGAVHAIYNTGTDKGLEISGSPNVANNTFWQPDRVFTEDDGGIPGVSKPDDRFGAALVARDFDNALAGTGVSPGVDDLAVGLPTELLYTNKRSGSVRVLRGFDGGGLNDLAPAAFAQSPSTGECAGYGTTDECVAGAVILGIEYSPLYMVEEPNDEFGAALTAADFDNDGDADLVIGVPGEDIGGNQPAASFEEKLTVPPPDGTPQIENAGILHVVEAPFPAVGETPPAGGQDLIYRSPGGFDAGNRINPTPPGDPSYSTVLTGDRFGGSLS